MRNVSLMEAMIEQCRDTILEHDEADRGLPTPLRRQHLIWMCNQMNRHLDDWRAIKLNRWIGFIQCAMIANGMIDLKQAKAMFDYAKEAFGEPSREWLDDLDPANPNEVDIGGEG